MSQNKSRLIAVFNIAPPPRNARSPIKGSRMLHLASQIADATAAVRKLYTSTPRVGIILGTGLGGLAGQIEVEAKIDYESLPHFPKSTAISHAGQLVCGKLNGVQVVAMEGRFHAYEGYSHQQITFPVRVMKSLGADL